MMLHRATFGMTRMYRVIFHIVFLGACIIKPTRAFVVPTSSSNLRQTTTTPARRAPSTNRLAMSMTSSSEPSLSSMEREIDEERVGRLFKLPSLIAQPPEASKKVSLLTSSNGWTIKALSVSILLLLKSNMLILTMKRFGSFYMMNLTNNPCITKSITAGVIGIAGDYLAQLLEYHIHSRRSAATGPTTAATNATSRRQTIHGQYHFRRGLAIFLEAIAISGPMMHVCYNWMEQVLPIQKQGGGSTLAALAHVLADSVVLDAFFVATAFVVTGLVEGVRLKRDQIPQFAQTLKASWATSIFIMPIEVLCFRLLPVSFRTLAVNLLDVLWDAIVSFMIHRHRERHRVVPTTHQTSTVMTGTLPMMAVDRDTPLLHIAS